MNISAKIIVAALAAGSLVACGGSKTKTENAADAVSDGMEADANDAMDGANDAADGAADGAADAVDDADSTVDKAVDAGADAVKDAVE